MVRPVHQSAKVVPFVHATNVDAIPHAGRNALCEIDVVGDQKRLAIADINDEALVTRVIVVVRQKAADEA